MMAQKDKIKAQASDVELEEFVLSRKEARKQFLKRIGIVVICVILIFAFCFPAVTTLIS
jgi:t-SNARE complex subunit (syntaxin)